MLALSFFHFRYFEKNVYFLHFMLSIFKTSDFDELRLLIACNFNKTQTLAYYLTPQSVLSVKESPNQKSHGVELILLLDIKLLLCLTWVG